VSNLNRNPAPPRRQNKIGWAGTEDTRGKKKSPQRGVRGGRAAGALIIIGILNNDLQEVAGKPPTADDAWGGEGKRRG